MRETIATSVMTGVDIIIVLFPVRPGWKTNWPGRLPLPEKGMKGSAR